MFFPQIRSNLGFVMSFNTLMFLNVGSVMFFNTVMFPPSVHCRTKPCRRQNPLRSLYFRRLPIVFSNRRRQNLLIHPGNTLSGLNLSPFQKFVWILSAAFTLFPPCVYCDLKVEAVIPFPIRFMSSVTSGSNNGSSLWVGKNNKQLVVSDETTRVEQIKLLDASEDAYGGVVVDMKDPMDSESFAYLLRASISQWRLQGKKGVWIKLPIELVNLVEAAVQEGFRYHHAEPSYLMLVKWISKTEDTLPANASHRIGIGAFVMNDMGEVLVVQEKNGKFKGTGVWKFPTGVVDQGEDICMAAVREVKEEAGIETEFLEILAFRQSHNSFFGKSDLFFLCMLRPLSFDIQKQDSEIEAAKWMPIEEYAAQPFNQKRQQFSKIANICLEKKKNNYTGFSAAPSTTAFSSKKNYLYFNNNGNNNLKQ